MIGSEAVLALVIIPSVYLSSNPTVEECLFKVQWRPGGCWIRASVFTDALVLAR